ncbi:short-chain dehydrogenase [Bacteroidota bacterium]|jgi:3-hydroxy acid dehydrogenase/malonic semialdehyde reductase|nr:short-chain dehydrogenase [Bacteroidota bacterium]
MSSIVLITGATSGFGKSCAELFAEKGHRLILIGRRADRLEKLAAALKQSYDTATYLLPIDVRNQEAITTGISSLPPTWQDIAILINNAGLAAGRDYFEEAKLDDWNEMIDTNIKGFLYVSQAVAKGMAIRKKGHIINIGSTAGKVVYEKGNAYCATKYAVDALNQSMRIDLLRHGIKVTAINPGAAETEFSLVRFKGDEETAASVYNGMKPLTPEDVAAVIYYTTTLPAHVCINDLTLTCVQQADSVYIHRK